MCTCIQACTHKCTTTHVWDLRAAYGSQFRPSPTLVLRTELKLSSLVANTIFLETNSPAPMCCFSKYILCC